MSARRDSRLDIVDAGGVLRVLRDVMVHRADGDEFVAISSEAGFKGEDLTIHVASEGNRPIAVRVIDSRPMIVNGSVRHQLRLKTIDRNITPALDAMSSGHSEAE